MINGMPRNRSVYPAAMILKGRKTGPRSVRVSATARPNTRMSSSATISTRMFNQSPSRIRGSASRPMSRLKNPCRTRGHPGARVTARYSTSAVTSVLATATPVERRARLFR